MTHNPPTPDHPALTAALLAWYAAGHRDLPWRRTRDPYCIWVSEIMLQQTRVSAVLPYYARFLARFPSVRALAEAELDEVLALWQGLGYYARARSLHRAARMMCERHGCALPSDPAVLRALPGIGGYTAGAILSIAFGQDEVALDGNVVRVLCRLLDDDQDPATAAGKRALRDHALALLPRGRAGEFNQALMELGATVCLPRAPRCAICPLAAHCRAWALGAQATRPIPKRRGATPQREYVAALVVGAYNSLRVPCATGTPLLIVRRLPQGLLGGLWELPGGEVVVGETHAQALARHLAQGLGLEVEVGAQVTTAQHAYTHFRLTLHVYDCRVQGEPHPAPPWDAHHWLTPDELPAYGLTGVTTKILARLSWESDSPPRRRGRREEKQGYAG